MQSARAIATRCCWPRIAALDTCWPVQESALFQEVHRGFSCFPFADPARMDGRERAVLQDRQVWEQIEALEHHPNVATHGGDILQLFS